MEIFNPQDDNLLKHLHRELNAFRQQAPQGLWQDISGELDNNPPVENDLTDPLDKHLNQEFKGFHQKAPLNLWDNISENLAENTTAPKASDGLLDEKVRNSYQSKTTPPELVWWNIEQQLNIDGIWRDMAPQLNQMRNRYRWALRLRQLGVAALFLLLIRGCGWFPTLSFDESTKDNPVLPVVEQVTLPNEEVKKENNSILPKPHATPKENNAATNKLPSLVQPPNTPLAMKNTSGTKKVETIGHEQNKTNARKGTKDEIAITFGTSNPLTNNNSTLIEEEKEPNHSLLSKNHVIEEAIARTGIIEPIDIPEVIVYTLHPKALTKGYEAVASAVDKHKIKFRPYTEIGFIGAIRNSILINDANTKALTTRTNRPISTMPNFTPGYGLSIDYCYAPRHALSVNFWINSKLRKDYEYSIHNKVSSSTVELNYLKLGVTERYSVFRYGYRAGTSIDIKGGFYLARLKSTTITYTGKSSLVPKQNISNWDAGIVFGLGQKHILKHRITFEYGVQTEIGLGNVFLQSQSKSPTNLMGFGVYTALRYRF